MNVPIPILLLVTTAAILSNFVVHSFAPIFYSTTQHQQSPLHITSTAQCSLTNNRPWKQPGGRHRTSDMVTRSTPNEHVENYQNQQQELFPQSRLHAALSTLSQRYFWKSTAWGPQDGLSETCTETSSTTNVSVSTTRTPYLEPSVLFTRLVQLGLDYQREQQQQTKQTTLENKPDLTYTTCPSTKVPGCVATVHVSTVLRRLSSASATAAIAAAANATHHSDNENEVRVHTICGTADAHVARGLLALVSLAVQNQSMHDILALDASHVTGMLGLEHVLSPSRNNGVASLWRTIQDQIRQYRVETEMALRLEPDHGHIAMNTTITTSTSGSVPVGHEASRSSLDNKETVTTAYTPPRVALLLSGGVDSSVALASLVQERHTLDHAETGATNNARTSTVPKFNVTAFYLKIWLADEMSHLTECPWQDDYAQCVAVCAQWNVPLETLSLSDQYQELVMRTTLSAVASGRTPNPDVVCNARIKFGVFYDEIVTRRHFDCIATGHYAQIEPQNDNGIVRLRRAPDPIKDQSYFLCTLTQRQLSRVLFPIGHLPKSHVRALAEQWQLPNRHRPDSQGLCFLGRFKFNDFLASVLPDEPGPIVDVETGQQLGTHRGIWYHTVGQRKGLGPVLQPTATSRGPWFVVAKHVPSRTIYCSNRYDQDVFVTARREFTVENVHWIAGHAPTGNVVDSVLLSDGGDSTSATTWRLTMKIRHGPKLASGTLTMSSLSSPTSLQSSGQVCLDEKDSGLAPGQYVAFYKDDECLGAGVISEQHWTRFLQDWKEAQGSPAPPMTDHAPQQQSMPTV
jgi:tRNA-5-taurinomethyluridine 2-sulfurtransferase